MRPPCRLRSPRVVSRFDELGHPAAVSSVLSHWLSGAATRLPGSERRSSSSDLDVASTGCAVSGRRVIQDSRLSTWRPIRFLGRSISPALRTELCLSQRDLMGFGSASLPCGRWGAVLRLLFVCGGRCRMVPRFWRSAWLHPARRSGESVRDVVHDGFRCCALIAGVVALRLNQRWFAFEPALVCV